MAGTANSAEARSLAKTGEFEFDAVRIPAQAFDDPQLCALVEGWAQMHAGNYGPGVTTKMGLYVIDPGGTLGYHVDGPVFLHGMRADLSAEPVLDALFAAGSTPTTLDGATEGILVATTTNRVLDTAVKALTSVWMPWRGMRFDLETGSGDNRMTESSSLVGKLLWPL